MDGGGGGDIASDDLIDVTRFLTSLDDCTLSAVVMTESWEYRFGLTEVLLGLESVDCASVLEGGGGGGGATLSLILFDVDLAGVTSARLLPGFALVVGAVLIS